MLKDRLSQDERRFLKATEPLYEQWKEKMIQLGVQRGLERGFRRGRQEGRKRGLLEGRRQGRAEALSAAYKLRFGSEPDYLRAVIGKLAKDEEALPRWLEIIHTRSEEEVADALFAGGLARPVRKRTAVRRGGANAQA